MRARLVLILLILLPFFSIAQSSMQRQMQANNAMFRQQNQMFMQQQQQQRDMARNLNNIQTAEEKLANEERKLKKLQTKSTEIEADLKANLQELASLESKAITIQILKKRLKNLKRKFKNLKKK